MGTSAIAADGTPSGGTPPAKPAGSEGGEGTPGGGGTGEPGAAGSPSTGLDRSKLSPLLAGMSEEQMNETFNTLFTAIRRPAEPAPKAPEPPKPLTNDDVKDRFDPMSDKFNPIGAVGEIVAHNYGGLINDIGKKANEGVFVSLRNKMADFAEHEDDVRKVLEQVPPNAINEQLVMQTFLGVVGAKEVGKRMSERSRAPSTHVPSPHKEETSQDLNPDEIEVAKMMFRNQPDPLAAYRKAQKMVDDGYTVKVPENS